MEDKLTQEDLVRFFEERPSLSRDGVAREAGVSASTLQFAMSGKRNLTERTVKLIMPVLRKYGFLIKM